MQRDRRKRCGKSAGRFGRLRTSLILELLAVVALTAGMLVRLGLFQSRRIANARLKQLCKFRSVVRVGLVQLNDAGRPEYLYARWPMKADNSQHNAELSLFLLHFLGRFEDTGDRLVWRRDCEVLTGKDVDQQLQPDATIIMNVLDATETKRLGREVRKRKVVHVEWDTGKMSYAQVTTGRKVGDKEKPARWDKYQGNKDLVLWIASSEARKEGFKERAQNVRGFMIFATAEDAVARPFEPVWSSWQAQEGVWAAKRCPKPLPEPLPVPVAVQQG